MPVGGCVSAEDPTGTDPRSQIVSKQDISSWKAESWSAAFGSREWTGRRGRPQRRGRVPATASPSSHLSRTNHGQLLAVMSENYRMIRDIRWYLQLYWLMTSDVVLEAIALPRGISSQFLLPRPRLVLHVCSSNLPRNENFDFDDFSISSAGLLEINCLLNM